MFEQAVHVKEDESLHFFYAGLVTAEQCNYLLLHCASFISLVLDFYFFHILISAAGEVQDSGKQGIAII